MSWSWHLQCDGNQALTRSGSNRLCFTATKVVPIIKCTCTVFIDNFRNISIKSSILVSVCRGSYDGYVKHKRNNPTCDRWDSQGNEKMKFLFLLLLALTFWSEMKISFPRNPKQDPFKIILHQILINECSIFDCPSNFEGLQLTLHARLFQMGFSFEFHGSCIFISDQNVNAKSNRNRNCIFSCPWESQRSHVRLFLLCFTYPS